MYSNVKNLSGQQVVRLEYAGILQKIDDTGALTAYSPEIQLELNQLYVINRIKFGLGVFKLPLVAGYMFPNYEQFWLNLKITCTISDVNGNSPQQLFSGFGVQFTDGYQYEKVFQEPFVFKTDTNYNYLYFVIENNSPSSVVSTLSTPVPPGGNSIDIIGSFSLEGVQYPSIASVNKIVDPVNQAIDEINSIPDMSDSLIG